MTFTEAAAQVLRLVGKPLHYKEITDVAIEKDLLSHVGKSPEVTMGARLAALVKKGDRDNPLIRVRPGVFALRDWDQKTIDAGLGDRTPALDMLAEIEKRHPEEENGALPSEGGLAVPRAERSQPVSPRVSEEFPEVLGEDEKARAQLAATATQLFASEEDDDDPIFGAEEEESVEGESLDSSGSGKRRRRRRRRRGGEREDDDLPTYTVMDAPLDAAEEATPRPVEARPPREGNRDNNRDNREARRPSEGRNSEGRNDEERERRPREARDEDKDRDRSAPSEEPSGSLADTIESLLVPFARQGGVSSRQIADALQRKLKSTFADPQQAHTAITSTVRIDNLRRTALGQRPRFRVGNGRLGLTEWSLDNESLRLERDLFAMISRYRDSVRRSFLRKLADLPQRGFAELVQLLLERLGYTDFKPVRRPGAHQAEQHFSALATGAFGEMRVAIVVRRDGRDIGRERVTELRGALHHYGPANGGVLVTTGQALSGAREEAAASAAAPMVLIDGATLSRLADEQAVGLGHSVVNLPLLDSDLLDSLKNGGER